MKVTEQTFITSKGIQQILRLLGFEFSMESAFEQSTSLMKVWVIGKPLELVFERELECKMIGKPSEGKAIMFKELQMKRAFRTGFHLMRKEKIITLEQLETIDIQGVDTISVTLLGDHTDNTLIPGPVDAREVLDALESLINCTAEMCNRETEDRWPIELVRAKMIADRYKM